MRKRRVLLFSLLVLLLVVVIPTGLLMRENRCEQDSQVLIAAIKANNTSAALAALKAGADPNVRDSSQDKPPSFGERFQLLLYKALHFHASSVFDKRQTALLYSVHNTRFVRNPWREMVTSDAVLVKALLDAGADPDLSGGPNDDTPLMLAAEWSDPQILRLLLQQGSNPWRKDNHGWTAMHHAATKGNVESVSLLLEAGADIDAQENYGITPLCLACGHGRLEAVQMMLDHHASLNIRGKDGKTALDYALTIQDAHIAILLRQAGAKTGAQLNATPKN